MSEQLRLCFSDFVFTEDPLVHADLIIAIGSSSPEIPEKAADIYENGYADRILVTGMYDYNCDCFPGLLFQADYYTGAYRTQADFYRAVLVKNRVPISSIIVENRARSPMEQAQFSRELLEKMKFEFNSAILICPFYQSRYYQILFMTAFPEVEFIMKPTPLSSRSNSLTLHNWYKSRYDIERVMREIVRISTDIPAASLERLFRDPEEEPTV